MSHLEHPKRKRQATRQLSIHRIRGQGIMELSFKQEINELLFQVLDDRTTLKEFEEIACAIYTMIIDHNDNKRGKA